MQGFTVNAISLYDDVQCRRDFEINRLIFYLIMIERTSYVEYKECENGREALTVKNKLLYSLVFVQTRFDIHKRDCCVVWDCPINRGSLCEMHLAGPLQHKKKVFHWPKGELQHEIATSLKQQLNIPNCTGFIDGMHISLSETPDIDDVNRIGYPSVVSQLITEIKC